VRSEQSSTASDAPTVVLASASTGRLSVLRGAGLDPVVLVSGVDEDALIARHAGAEPEDLVAALAGAKAEAVVRDHHDAEALVDAVVIGGDSMLLLDEALQGKPHTRDEALRRWEAQAGRTGTLLSGCAVLRVREGNVAGRAGATAATAVRFGTPSIDEITAYIDSGEPLGVAGAFTIDGLGGWFVERIDGDPSCVVGLSLPLLRRLLAENGISVTDLWRTPC
jgi:septum formation protein